MTRSIPFIALFACAVFLVGCADDFVAEQSAVAADLEVAAAKKPAPQVSGVINYVFAGHLGQFDDEGRILAWDATIEGDVNGEMKWWFVPEAGPPHKSESIHVGFYEARWEIWDGETLLLAGNSSGTTALPKDRDGIWRGNGVVTEASPDYQGWMDRRIFEGGNVNLDGLPYGQGEFRIF